MTSSTGDLLDLDITGIAHGGTFIARHDGRVIFVSDAIPGERVRARITDASKQSFWRAETLEVLEASPHRRAHIWPEADVTRAPEQRVGGADLGHIALNEQRVLKRQVLSEALAKFAGAGIDAPEVQALDDSDGTGWRTRVTLHVDQDGVIGPFAARSHRVVPVASHPLAVPTIAEAAARLRTAAPGAIELVQPADGDVRVLLRPDAGRRGETELITEHVAGRSFSLDAGGFWQVHRSAAETLDQAVRELLAGRVDPASTHLDLYGGVGLFAATLAELGATELITVESDRGATAHAQQNLAEFSARAVTARVDRFLGLAGSAPRPVRRRRPSRPDPVAGLDPAASIGAVVLDPPRAGAGRAVVEAITDLDPDAIVYVACDPVAFARDLGTFHALGWRAEAMRAYDLFPNTHHFEVVALLTR